MFNWLDRLENRRLLRLLLLFALGWIGVQLVYYFAYVLLVFLFSAILAFLLNYPVRRLKRYLPHGFAVTLVFLGTLALFIGFGITLGLAIVDQLQALITSLPEQIDLWIESLEKMQQFFRRWNLDINFRQLESELRNFTLAGIQFGFGKLQSVFGLFLGGIIVAVVTFFMLLEGEPLWQYLLSFLPDPWRDRLPLALKRNFLGFFWGAFSPFAIFWRLRFWGAPDLAGALRFSIGSHCRQLRSHSGHWRHPWNWTGLFGFAS